MPFWKSQQAEKISSDAAAEAARRGPAVRRPGPANLAGVRNLVAVGSGKGGVGKSTVAVQLAVALARMGAKVGLMDADIYGPSQPGMLGASGKKAEESDQGLVPLQRHGVGFISIGLLMNEDGPVVWRAPMAMKMLYEFIGNVAWGDLDYLLIDMPPGTGDVQLTLAQQAPLTGAVIVTTPQDVALGIAKKGLKMFQQVNVPILGIVENMSGFHCAKCGAENNIFKTDGGRRLAAELSVPFLGGLPLDPAFVESGDAGVPLLEKDADSPSAQAVLKLAREFEREIARVNQASLESGEAEKVEIGPAGDVQVKWADGKKGIYPAYHLRINCPCAACVDEVSGRRVLDPKSIPMDIKAAKIAPVGRYGVAITFSDGHGTGIYTLKYLRSLLQA